MCHPDRQRLLCLLVKAYNCAITDYFYFPEVIYAGTTRIERSDFETMLAEQLVTLVRFDSFGRYYTLSKKAEQLIQHPRHKAVKKKGAAVPLTQGCFYFARVRNPQGSGARCLAFL